MRLRVLCPHGAALERDVARVAAEGEHGCFTLLPRHVGFVASLVPGILSFLPVDRAESPAAEEFVAVDAGLLVKVGREVQVAVRSAVVGAPLGELEATIRLRSRELERGEQRARSALARLEADFVRRFAELYEAAG